MIWVNFDSSRKTSSHSAGKVIDQSLILETRVKKTLSATQETLTGLQILT